MVPHRLWPYLNVLPDNRKTEFENEIMDLLIKGYKAEKRGYTIQVSKILFHCLSQKIMNSEN